MEEDRDERRRRLAELVGWTESLEPPRFDNVVNISGYCVYKYYPERLTDLPGQPILGVRQPNLLDPKVDLETAAALVVLAMDRVNRGYQPVEDAHLLAEKWIVRPRIALEEMAYLSCGIDPQTFRHDLGRGDLFMVFSELIRDQELAKNLEVRVETAWGWSLEGRREELVGDEKPTAKQAWLWLKGRATLGGWKLPTGLEEVFSRLEEPDSESEAGAVDTPPTDSGEVKDVKERYLALRRRFQGLETKFGTQQKLILAAAKTYGWNPSLQRQSATTKWEKVTTQMGIFVEAGTILTHVREALEANPSAFENQD